MHLFKFLGKYGMESISTNSFGEYGHNRGNLYHSYISVSAGAPGLHKYDEELWCLGIYMVLDKKEYQVNTFLISP